MKAERKGRGKNKRYTKIHKEIKSLEKGRRAKGTKKGKM